MQLEPSKFVVSSTADCDTVFSDVIDMGSSTDQFALINDACNYQSEISPGVMQTVYLSKDAVAGYVEFENELALFAPIKCAGACHSREIRLPDLSLDWEVDFKVSTTEYELSAKQETADWDDFTKDSDGDSHFTMHKVSYLAPAGTDRCLADGSVSGDVPTSGDTSADPKGCLVFKDSSDPSNDDAFGQGTVEYSGITGSADMRNWLAACGSYLEDGMGAKAQLVQRFEVEYEDGFVRTPSQLPSVESFCDSKDLTLSWSRRLWVQVSESLLLLRFLLWSSPLIFRHLLARLTTRSVPEDTGLLQLWTSTTVLTCHSSRMSFSLDLLPNSLT